MTLLAVEGLVVRYGALTALRGVSLRLEEGEVFFVTGPNGAGKSTLLKAIAGVVAPAGGSVRLMGREVAGAAPEAIARLGFSMVPEGRQVFGSLTVEENLRLGIGVRADRAAAARDLEAIYDVFPMLRDRRRGPAGLLSGGQQQMLAIGRALMAAPRLVLFDEISLGLAPVVMDRLYEALAALRATGLAMLIVEQDVQRALALADEVHVMEHGRIALSGHAQSVRSDPRLRQLYIGGADAGVPDRTTQETA